LSANGKLARFLPNLQIAGDSPGDPEFTFQVFDFILRDSALTEMG